MIIDELFRYYRRMADDPGSGMPEPGYSEGNVSFAVVVREDGELAGVMDLRESRGKKVVPRKMKVPAAVKRQSNIAPNFRDLDL